MAHIHIIAPLSVSPGASDVIEWHFPPDLESEISTLATSCHVRQQQREPIVQSAQQDEDGALDLMDDGECTRPFSTLTLDSDTEMKSRFLDRLAELLCYDKKPVLITSTALVSDTKDNIIVCARNSSTRGNTWSTKDVDMLEHLAEILEKTSSGEPLDYDTLLELQKVLVEYYSQRIKHHAKQLMSLEQGMTGMAFFNEAGCGAIASGSLSIYQFAKQVETLSYSTDFYRILKIKLSATRRRRVLDELAFIGRPMQGPIEFLFMAQKCTWFQNLKIYLLKSLPSRKVKAWNLPQAGINLKPQQEMKFNSEIRKPRNIHAEMMLIGYIFSIMRRGLVVFPYLGVSKKTCLLCGYMLREIAQFDTRGNHGKCYSQWTLPPILRAIPDVTERLGKAVFSLRDILQEEEKKEAAHMDAERESSIAAAIPTKHKKEADIFNEVGRPIDATDQLVLACHKDTYPEEEDVAKRFGFMSFISGTDRLRLFELYRRLVVDYKVDEDELRAALEQRKLKEMLMFRCGQTNDPCMLSDKDWLKNQERFEVDGRHAGLITLFEATQEELLSANDRKLPLDELQPREKQKALLFYVQIRNGFKPDTDEDNWITLGLCTAPDAASETQLCSAYASLIQHCTYEEFWNCIAKSSIVELFEKYGLTHTISHMRNFKDHMAHVKKWYASVWELKRFTRMQDADPSRAVVVDYGFINCTDASQRMQLRETYQQYFNDGHDEMSLHEVCISGQLATFLELVLGTLSVPSQLLNNPYPLKDYSLMGLVVPSVVVCPESAVDQVRELHAVGENDSVIITIPDTEHEDQIQILQERAAFLGTGLRERYYSQEDGGWYQELRIE
ncbi:hypothetical protein NW768_007636 [Fusarium equiseti]|uniref:Uncharacterized protein n=1 Tax=Fusarium equiseti TaxID=61235 RepID=A0ABQ8R825_FUSEQ|nr:hypothetical protein NW768_007636 [Fusarium equiseti]